MAELSLQVYVLLAVGAFVYYLMRTRQRNIRSLEEARNATLATAAAVTKKKQASERFVNALSFDLRTPLNVVGAVSERLSELRGLSPAAARRVRIIQSAAQMLLNIIVNMVDVRTIERGGVLTSAEPKPVDVVQLVRRIGSIMVFYAHRKQLKLKRRIAATVPRAALGDPLRVQQILVNLVNNAIRYVLPCLGLITVLTFSLR
jgi:signal transduction histidine kinase